MGLVVPDLVVYTLGNKYTQSVFGQSVFSIGTAYGAVWMSVAVGPKCSAVYTRRSIDKAV